MGLSSSQQRRKQCVNEKKNRFCKAHQKENNRLIDLLKRFDWLIKEKKRKFKQGLAAKEIDIQHLLKQAGEGSKILRKNNFEGVAV